jgi:hypothetical protein
VGAIAELSHGRCDSCGAIVKWGVTVSGSQMPIDPIAMPDGTVFVVPSGKLRVLTADEADRGRRAGAVLYRSHFFTCPAAAAHRGINREQMTLL